MNAISVGFFFAHICLCVCTSLLTVTPFFPGFQGRPARPSVPGPVHPPAAVPDGLPQGGPQHNVARALQQRKQHQRGGEEQVPDHLVQRQFHSEAKNLERKKVSGSKPKRNHVSWH